MLYKKEKQIFINGTVSAVMNNVAVNVSKYQKTLYGFAVIDRQTVRVMGTENSMDSATDVPQYCLDTKTDVTQIHWCTLGYINCLVVTCSEGLIVYDCDQQFKRIYTHNCEDKNMKEKYAKGIATFECTYLCVGNSNGSIRVFGPDEEGQVVFLDRKLLHGAPITDMSSYKQNLVSCDESGCTVLSQIDCGELMIIARTKVFGGLVNIQGSTAAICFSNNTQFIHDKTNVCNENVTICFRHPCTTTEMTRIGTMAVGYGCGTIRIFDPSVKLVEGDAEDQLPTVIQMSAHARCVTSMSAAKDSDLLLSVSEDSWIRVWKINTTTVTLLYCYMREDTMFVGCQFMTRNGSKFCTTAYDSPYITCYTLNQL